MSLFLFYLKKTVTALILPPAIFFIFLFGFMFQLKGIKRITGTLLVLFFWLASSEFVGESLVHFKENYPFVYSEIKNSELTWDNLGKTKIDLIVLLGGGQVERVSNGDWGIEGRPSDVAVVRLAEVKRIYDKLKQKILISGGPAPNSKGRSEAELMKHFLIDLGVPEKEILLEESSIDTQGNGYFVAKMTKEKGFKNILLVTSHFHMERSYGIFRHAFKNQEQLLVYPISYSSPQARSLSDFSYLDFFPGDFLKQRLVLREYLGLLFYLLKDGKPID